MKNNIREDLIDLLISADMCAFGSTKPWPQICADFLVQHGVTIQKRGKWKFNDDGSGTCDRCGMTQRAVWDYDSYQLYCGCCGAKMSGGA